MTDRELLELAAKAAGLPELTEWGEITDYDSPHYMQWALYESGIGGQCKSWSPLTDDGDALRLMVDKRFTVKVDDHEVEVFDEWGECLVSIGMQADEDYHAATRRAIVRAAAAIGQGME